MMLEGIGQHSEHRLRMELSNKYVELNSVEKDEEKQNHIFKMPEDIVEISGKVLDKSDYERVLNDPAMAAHKLDQLSKSASAVDMMSSADSAIAISANLMKQRLQLQESENIN